MNRLLPAVVGLAAVGILAVVAMGLYFNNRGSGVGGPEISPIPSTAASPTASLTPSATPTAGYASTAPSTTPAAGLAEGPFEFQDRGMAMTVDIPSSGWSFDAPFTLLEKGVQRDNLPEAGILFWSYPGAAGFDVYGDPCQWASTIPATPATTVDEFADALAEQPSRDASEPVDVTVGGYPGKSLILHVPADVDPEEECDEGNFASYGVAGDAEPSRYHQGPGQIDELWILDVDGTILVIDAMYRPDTPMQLIEEMRALVQSITFQTP